MTFRKRDMNRFANSRHEPPSMIVTREVQAIVDRKTAAWNALDAESLANL